MNVPGLTRDNVASHLQKHRMHVKKTRQHRDGQKVTQAITQSDPAASTLVTSQGGASCMVCTLVLSAMKQKMSSE